MIIENNFIPNIASKISGMYIIGVTIFLWVFIRTEHLEDEETCNHEQIHVEQYKETFLLGFFFIYAFDFVKGILKGMSWDDAYLNTRFEKEAYSNETNLTYLKNRKRYNWF